MAKKNTTASRAKANVPPVGPSPRALLAWYDRHRRRLPWRAGPGEGAEPYAVWLSEIMLQQTTVAAVKSYFEKFLTRWPTVADLANADTADVMAAWAGLGYYARARNLHACAKVVATDHGGCFPDTEQALRALPGIGPYTAAAIAAIAFDRKAVVVDGNVERVMARVFGVIEPPPKSKPRLVELAARLTPARRPGDYAQAVMDLGATICTPRSPACSLCPWMAPCVARAKGIAETLPRKIAKAPTPTRHGVAFWMVRGDGAVLLRRRPPNPVHVWIHPRRIRRGPRERHRHRENGVQIRVSGRPNSRRRRDHRRHASSLTTRSATTSNEYCILVPPTDA